MHARFPSAVPRRWLLLLGLLTTITLANVAAFAQGVRGPAGPVPGGDQIPEYRIRKGEELLLRATSGGNVAQVVVSQPGIVDISEPDPNRPSPVIRVVGKEVGTVRITLSTRAGDDQPTVVNVSVLPTPGEAEAAAMAAVRRQEEAKQRAFQALIEAVNRQFPSARVQLTRTGERSVMVNGSVDNAEEIDAIIRYLRGYGYQDVANNLTMGGVQQVQLEVCIAQVNRTELRRYGFNFLASNADNYLGSSVGNLFATPDITPGGGIGTFSGDILTADPNLFFGLTGRNSAFLGFLEALRVERLAKVLANPVLVTLSGRPATFLSGGEQPYPTPAAVGQPPGVEFRPFGTRLTFLPVVLSDGRIRLEVETEVSRLDFANAISFAGTTVPQFLTQRVHATVEMSNGQTFAIGGLMQTTVDARTDKVPCLGDAPFFGSFFRRVRYEESEQELLVLVTVRLVDPMDCAQRGQTKMPGQETRTPTDFELFLEGIMEAPRGQRPLCVDGQYRSAHYWAGSFCDPAPGHCGNGACAPGAGYAPAANVQQVGVTVGMPVGTRSEPTTQVAPVDAVAPAMRGSIVPPSDVQRAVTVDVEAVPTETPAVLPTEAVQKPEVAPAPMPPAPVPPPVSPVTTTRPRAGPSRLSLRLRFGGSTG